MTITHPRRSLSSCQKGQSPTKRRHSLDLLKLLPNVGENDVICGRASGRLKQSGGNSKFHALVNSLATAYDGADPKDKAYVSKQVVDQIHTRGGKFLNLNQTTKDWEELTYKRAVEKTSQTFRDLRPKFQSLGRKPEPRPTRKVYPEETGHVSNGVCTPVQRRGSTSSLPDEIINRNKKRKPRNKVAKRRHSMPIKEPRITIPKRTPEVRRRSLPTKTATVQKVTALEDHPKIKIEPTAHHQQQDGWQREDWKVEHHPKIKIEPTEHHQQEVEWQREDWQVEPTPVSEYQGTPPSLLDLYYSTASSGATPGLRSSSLCHQERIGSYSGGLPHSYEPDSSSRVVANTAESPFKLLTDPQDTIISSSRLSSPPNIIDDSHRNLLRGCSSLTSSETLPWYPDPPDFVATSSLVSAWGSENSKWEFQDLLRDAEEQRVHDPGFDNSSDSYEADLLI